MQDIESKKLLLESFYSAIGEKKSPVKSKNGDVVGYTSKELKNKFVKSINSNNFFENNTKKLMVKAIDEKGAIPVYTHNLWLLDITENFFKIFVRIIGLSHGSIMGFYDGTQIVLMTSNLRNLEGDISNKIIYNILTHEFQHRFAGEASGFSNDTLVKTTLKKWFEKFISNYFGEDIDETLRIKLMKFFCNIKSEANKSILKGHIEKRYDELVDIAESLGEDHKETFKKLARLINYVYHSYTNQILDDEDIAIFRLCQKTYKDIGINPDTWIFQEFLVASEVICVCASNNRELGNKLLSRYLSKVKYKGSK